MQIKSYSLEKVCGLVTQLPKNIYPEIVLCGRSNVGKSSFINTFVNHNNFARTSSTPGKTETVNFYLINKSFYLVDLPGYGFTKNGGKRDKFGELINAYFAKSEKILDFIILIDSRLPMQEIDKQMFDFATEAKGYHPLIVATKCDKLKTKEKETNILSLRKEYNLEEEDKLIMFSSTNKTGINEIKNNIDLWLKNLES